MTITVTYPDKTTAAFDADNWQMFRGVTARQETTFTGDIELRKGDVPVAIIGTGTYFSIVLNPTEAQ